MVEYRALSSVVEHRLDVTRVGGSIPSARTESENLPCGRFSDSVRGAAMSRQLARPRAGVAKNASDGEHLFVTTKCEPEQLGCEAGSRKFSAENYA